MVAGRLAGGIRGMGAVRRGFRKQAVPAQSTVHFVGGNVMEAETLLPFPLQGAVVIQGGLKHGKSPHHVRGNEIARIVNGAVHMGFRRQVHHPVRGILLHGAPHQFGIPHVRMQKTVRGQVCHVIQGMNVARISQGVNVQDFTAALQQQPDQIGADESGSARNDNSHHTVFRKISAFMILGRMRLFKTNPPMLPERSAWAEKRCVRRGTNQQLSSRQRLMMSGLTEYCWPATASREA